MTRAIPPPEKAIQTTNDMEHRKSRLEPDGSTRAPDREESRHVGRNLGGHIAITILLPPFSEQMKRWHGDACKAIDAAYVHCSETHIQRDSDCTGCPWENKGWHEKKEHPCFVMILRGMGFVSRPLGLCPHGEGQGKEVRKD